MRALALALAPVLAPVLALASCTHDVTVLDRADAPVARDLDVLYVIDSSSARGNYDAMASQLATLTARLAEIDGQVPSLHVGVVTTDLGTRGRLDAQPGAAVGNCAGDGDAGKLVDYGGALLFGDFLQDLRGPGGTRIRNFDATLVQALGRLTNPGPDDLAAGCEFIQPLEAMRRALDPATNPGFIRPDAMLSIVFVTNRDDCSLSRGAMLDPSDASLGPPFTFRCTEQGVICDPDQPRQPGVRASCRPRDGSSFMTDVSEYRTFLAGYKPDPRDVTVAAVTGPRSSFEVLDIGVPALAPSCQGAGGTAMPAVRLGALVDSVGGALVDACTQDGAYQRIAAPIVERQRGCVPELRGGADACTVSDVAGDAATPIARCAEGSPAPCWYAVRDDAACAGGDHLRIAVNRGGMAAPAGSHVRAVCPAG